MSSVIEGERPTVSESLQRDARVDYWTDGQGAAILTREPQQLGGSSAEAMIVWKQTTCYGITTNGMRP
jgi:hypothetical protein